VLTAKANLTNTVVRDVPPLAVWSL